MDAWSVFPAASAVESEPPFVVRRPAGGLAGPLVFASPHSGRLYPQGLMAASQLDALAIRRSEDALVDQLVLGGVDHGASLICAAFARAYIDVNREPYELDPAMFEDELPDFARGRSSRVAAGLGSIARIVGEGQEIYGRKLTFAEAQARIEAIHTPYHTALKALVGEALAGSGAALLVDWHSMPAAAARPIGRDGCDVVLGDRFGAACSGRITDGVEAAFIDLGYRVSRNTPYAGGFTTEAYGRPRAGTHVLQIELNRNLYLNEAILEPHAGYEALRANLQPVFRVLAALAGGLGVG